jgi:hypothetical protein
MGEISIQIQRRTQQEGTAILAEDQRQAERREERGKWISSEVKQARKFTGYSAGT